jgi:hypothetical protein
MAETKQDDVLATAICSWRTHLTLAYMRANGYTSRNNWLLGPDGIMVCRGKENLYRLRHDEIWEWFWDETPRDFISAMELDRIVNEQAAAHGFDWQNRSTLARGSYQYMTLVTIALRHYETPKGKWLLALRVDKPYSAGTAAQADEANGNVTAAESLVVAILKRVGGRFLPDPSNPDSEAVQSGFNEGVRK